MILITEHTDSRYLLVESLIVTVANGSAMNGTARSVDSSTAVKNSSASTTLSMEMETGTHIRDGALLKVTACGGGLIAV